MDNSFTRERCRGFGRRGPGLFRKGAGVFLALSLLLPAPAARAAEFEITADSFTVVNQVNISSVTYFQARTAAPPDPASATQLLTPGGLYFDATYYNVWDRTALAWVKLATGTAEAGRVAKAGDFMSGQLTTASTITVQGNAFSVGASTFVVIGGNVGVGTASPAARLDVAGGGIFKSTSGISNVWFGYNDGTRDYGVYQWQAAGAAPANYFQNNIGIGTTSPGARLHVSGSSYPQFSLDDNASRTYAMGVTGGTLRIRDVTGVADRVTMDPGGNVGIGTTSPGQKLHVTGGNIRVDNGYALWTRNAANTADVNMISMDASNTMLVGSAGVTGDLTLFAGGERMRILSSNGNVGVGTASPGAKLEVSGDIKASNFQNSWTSYTPTTSLGHTSCVGRYIVLGKIVHVQLYIPAQALTTTAASWSISLPLTSAANLPTELARTVFINASSTRQTGLLIVNAAASSVDVYNGPGLGAWSPAYSGSGLAGTLISYPID